MYLRSTLGILLLLALATMLPPARAQDSEDEEEEAGFGYVFAEVSSWIAQPAGLGYSPATRHDSGNVFSTNVLRTEIGTKSEMYTKVGYVMPGEMGAFMISFYDHLEDDIRLTEHNPGNFVYGETLAHPLFAGFAYDGRADYFDSTSHTQLSDFRFDFIRKAFERPKVNADWFVGVRRVKHRRGQSARYTALVPDLPVLLPPVGGPFPALDPRDDLATMRSDFIGRGLEAGMDFEIPLLRNRLTLDAGFSIGLIRGDIDSAYTSQTRYYVLNVQGVETLLFPPYSELLDTRETQAGSGIFVPLAGDTEQRSLQIGLVQNRISTASSVLETRVGIRWKAWQDFTFSVGFRSAHYSDVGIDLRPVVTTIPADLRVEDGELLGVNLESVTEVKRSATYEGIYIAVGYKY